ncbi:MAG: 30S ribosomal protein S21 [Planctomycetes bacterium]|jgi:small subunit ribosomal protein S21|nr:30S ribosomal protein S21 [Planctomycetota bacterium]
MIKVQVRSNEPLEAALRRFKRQCNYAGIFRLAKKYAYFEKRSDRLRREEREKIRNLQRALRKAEDKGGRGGRPRRKSKLRPGQGGRDDEGPEETTGSMLERPRPIAAPLT